MVVVVVSNSINRNNSSNNIVIVGKASRKNLILSISFYYTPNEISKLYTKNRSAVCTTSKIYKTNLYNITSG